MLKGFVCYACGERGDVFAFVSKIEKVGFAEAAKRLTKELTIENGQLIVSVLNCQLLIFNCQLKR